MDTTASPKIEQRLQAIEQDVFLFRKMLFSLLSFLQNRNQTPPTIIPKQKNDQQVWQDIKKDYEQIQEKLFQERYPSLYAKIKQAQ